MPLTRYGRKVRLHKCQNKSCRNYHGSMTDIGSRDYENHYCISCGSHYYGKAGSILKFWTKQEWEKSIEDAWLNNH